MGLPLSVSWEWREAIREYLAELSASHRPESTRGLRSYHLRRFAVTVGVGPFDVTAEILRDYMGGHPNWSLNTARSVRSTLRSFYKWARRDKRMKKNPASRLAKVKSEIGTPRPAPEDAVTVGLNAVDRRVRVMVGLAAWAGLRCCEIAVVHRKDLVKDPQGWVLRVHGKGGKTRRVPLVDELAHVVGAADGWLFPGNVDGHLSAAYVSKLVSRALPQGWTAHTLRHRFASAAYLADRDIRAVQELLGHASVATTQIYTAVPYGSLRRAVLGALSPMDRIAG